MPVLDLMLDTQGEAHLWTASTLSGLQHAVRDDDRWAFVSAWGVPGDGRHVRHAEPLAFDAVPLTRRNYK